MGLEKVHTDLTAEQLNAAVQANERAWNIWILRTHTLHKKDQNPQVVFGYMVELALPVLEAYFSDLYHDVEDLQSRDWSKAQMFFFAVGKCGTNIVDKLSEAEMLQKHGRERVYQFKYTHHPRFKDCFQLTIKRLH